MLDLTPEMALRIIRECAEDSERVFYSPHARQRMRERHISFLDINRCLANGKLSEPPHQDVRKSWRCTVAHNIAGHHISVAVGFRFNEKGEKIVVITTF